ncbi:MAG: hypothetical protein JWM27_1725 [Gemmatimonadetes bacterium]|nr:hypothetical protein [Gemmatimonadota bacterium]
MAREVTDDEGIVWTCTQAYAGLGEHATMEAAAEIEGAPGKYRVVCTPSGGTQSVELELPGDWEKALADGDLLAGIQDKRRA